MAIVSVAEHWSGRTGSLRDDYSRQYVRVFKVVASTDLEDPQTVMLADGIPRVRSHYVGSNGAVDKAALLREITPDQNSENPRVWMVTCRYETREEELGKGQGNDGPGDLPDPQNGGTAPNKAGQPGTQQSPQSPEARPPEVEWTTEQYTEVMTRAYDETTGELTVPVINSARTPFDPPLERMKRVLVLRYTRNEIIYDSLAWSEYIDSVNEDNFLGWGPGVVKCSDIVATRQYEDGLFFWRITYTFHIKRSGWDRKVLDQGTSYFADGEEAGNRLVDRDNVGQPTGAVVLLDGAGHKLSANATPVYLTFREFPRLDFGKLKIRDLVG